jgi:hypothetical protein
VAAMSTQPDDSNSIHLTGREVALAAAADFSSFFLPGSPFAFPIHFGPVGHPLIRKDSQGTRIVLPNEMASDIIEKADRLFLHRRKNSPGSTCRMVAKAKSSAFLWASPI